MSEEPSRFLWREDAEKARFGWYYENPYPRTLWQRALVAFGIRRAREGGFKRISAAQAMLRYTMPICVLDETDPQKPWSKAATDKVIFRRPKVFDDPAEKEKWQCLRSTCLRASPSPTPWGS